MAALQKKVQVVSHKVNLPELCDLVPKRDRDQLMICEKKMQATIDTVDVYAEERAGDFKDARKDIAAAKSAANGLCKEMNQSIAEAEKKLSEDSKEKVKEQVNLYLFNASEDADPT